MQDPQESDKALIKANAVHFWGNFFADKMPAKLSLKNPDYKGLNFVLKAG